MNFDHITDAEYETFPLVVEGESKIVRRMPDHLQPLEYPPLCLIRFKPTIYSFTANRTAVVPGSDLLRLRATKLFLAALEKDRVRHAYRYVGEKYIIADLIAQPPPIEVVVKAFHTGTSKHRYVGMNGARVRPSHPLYLRDPIVNDGPYPRPRVRFDWRNPFVHPTTGAALADEVLGEETADLFIDVKQARLTALQTFRSVSNFLQSHNIICYDLCLFISEDGRTVFGEISQDCGRFRHLDLGSLDKDVWRAGGSSDQVLSKWQLLLDLLEKKA